MTSFVVHGPFDLAFEARRGGRTLVFDEFWTDGSPAFYLAAERGCYAFAIRTGPGLIPVYVGKATKTFKQETFNPSNRHKYHNGFSEYAKGSPLMYFIVHPRQKGRTNNRVISEIESFLIQCGVVKNPGIQNVQGTSQPKWSIKGIVRSGAGKRTDSEKQVGRLFGISDQ